MSVDSLFQHIVLTQQQAQERRRIIQEVKSEASICHEKIVDVTENLREAKSVLENKLCLLLEKSFQNDLLVKRRNGLEIQRDELLKVMQDLQFELQKMKKARALEEETFMKEVLDYNSNYGLTSNREELVRAQVKVESQRLDKEADTLRAEIESLKSENFHLNAAHLQRNLIQRQLSELEEALKGLDEEIAAAICTTKSLKAEKLTVSQKPQSDAECLRLKKELESYKEDNLESTYETLRTEIQCLKRKVPHTSTPRTVQSQEDSGH